MRMSCLKIAGARRLLRMLSGCVHSVVEVSQEMAIELRRLNSARLGEDELSRLAPRERARAVKAALDAHHAGISRCC
jgi:hypothetical protein